MRDGWKNSKVAPTANAERNLGIVVRNLAADEEPLWDAFVRDVPGTSFLHLLGWRRVIERTLGHSTHYRTAWRGGRLVGILPLVQVRSRLFGHALFSPGFGVFAGIAAVDEPATKALADDAAALGVALRVDYIELRHEKPRAIDWPERRNSFATFQRALSPSVDANFKAIPRKKRADLRKAIDNRTLQVSTGIDVATFFGVYSHSVRNLGTPVLPFAYYRAIAEELGPAVEISAVHGPDGLVAAVMSFHFKDRVSPYYGGAFPWARRLHAYDLMYWDVMRRATERGIQIFDFGRSMIGSGAFDYKTYWGFTPEPLHYNYHLVSATTLPEVDPRNPKYHLMVNLWKKLPLFAANLMGPIIARQIG